MPSKFRTDDGYESGFEDRHLDKKQRSHRVQAAQAKRSYGQEGRKHGTGKASRQR